jgi:hypothetical protein
MNESIQLVTWSNFLNFPPSLLIGIHYFRSFTASGAPSGTAAKDKEEGSKPTLGFGFPITYHGRFLCGSDQRTLSQSCA